MSDAVVAALGLLAGEVVMLAVFAWMPVMRGGRAFFGVRVGRETYAGEGRRLLRRYRQTLGAVFAVTAAAGHFASARLGGPLPSLVSCLAAAAGFMLVYVAYARRVRPFAVESGRTRFASSVRARSLGDYTAAWLEVSVVLLTVVPFLLLGHFYPQLPERVPVHWNFRGVADAWAPKSFSTVFFMPALGAYVQALFIVLKRDIAHAKMTLPATNTEAYLRGKESFLRTNMRLLDWARACVAAVFFAAALMTVFTCLPGLGRLAPAANAAVLAASAALLAGVFYHVRRMAVINAEIEELTGDEYVQRAAEERRWIHGGLAYYNPEDPALAVEKLVGLGYTLNLGHRGVRYRLLLLAGIPLFVLWALSSL